MLAGERWLETAGGPPAGGAMAGLPVGAAEDEHRHVVVAGLGTHGVQDGVADLVRLAGAPSVAKAFIRSWMLSSRASSRRSTSPSV